MDGHHIQAGRDADGEPLHAGDRIEIWALGHWLPGRYECNFSTGAASFHTRLFDPSGREETVFRIDRDTMRFRRPSEAMREDLADRLTRAHAEQAALRRELRDLRSTAKGALRDVEEDPEMDRAGRYEGALEEIVATADQILGKDI